MHGIIIRPLDAAIVVAYLVGLLAIGILSARRSATAENYFVGHRDYPGWLIALSMLGSIVSSMTFLALPAAAYVLDWRQLTVNLMAPFVALLAVAVFIPFFRRGGLTSAFEYLGLRFGPVARLYGAVNFIVLQLIRLAQVLFLMSLPMQFLTGVPLEWVIGGVGLFVALVTIAGGMETVVVADAVQAVIKVLGGVLCAACLIWAVPGGLAQIVEVGRAGDKFSLGSFDWDLTQRTFWTVAILGILNYLNIYSGEQTVVQRYVSARTTREARKATLMFSFVAVPVWTLFFFVGTALWVFFQVAPDPRVAALQVDQILPYFVLTHVPAGLAGLVIAAVLAAAMSAIESGANSIAAVTVVDLLRPYLLPGRSDRFYLQAARLTTGAAIALAVGGAILFSRMEKESMNDVSLIVFSVLGGAVTGLYMVGFFTRRVDGVAVNIALAVAVAANLYLGLGALGMLPDHWRLGVHSYWVGAMVNLVFVAVALAIGLVRRPPPRDLTGLTVWTPRRPGAARCLLAVLTLAGAASARPRSAAADETVSPQRPPARNAVLIVIDDLGYGDLGCYGSRVNATPQIDALAARGCRFTDFHAAAPLCTPTRAALLTGRYHQRLGATFDDALSGDRHRRVGLPREAVTLGELFRSAGRATAYFGKWHLGFEPPHLPPDHGFDEFRGSATAPDYFTRIDRQGKLDWWRDNAPDAPEGYTTDLITRAAVDFIDRNHERPFLLCVAHEAIHFPWQGPDDPPHRVAGRNYDDDKWGVIPDPTNVAAHVGPMLAAVDRSIGAITAAFARHGLGESTVVVFTSDNGGYLNYGRRFRNISSNGPFRGQKAEMYEGGHRVPLIIARPGTIPPGVSGVPCNSIDILPTLAGLTGVVAGPVDADGIDLSPLLLRGERPAERQFYWRAGRNSAIRSGAWKLCTHGDRTELFNLAEDPGEQHDVAAALPEKVVELRADWQAWEAGVNRSAAAGDARR
jgi:SSS family transporter